MEGNYKLKVKIGNHEFEAEGPTEVVQEQFAAFKEIVTAVPRPVNRPEDDTVGRTVNAVGSQATLTLEKIMKADGRVVSLTATAASVEDAIMLLMLGQKVFRTNDSVTGGEILDGLRQSGHVLDRVDRTLDKLVSDGHVIKVGLGRGSRYRLTNQGVGKAQAIARDVIALVA